MITIQEAHKYLELTKVGMARPILCPVDNDHLPMVSWMDDEDIVSFICIACNTKITPGDNLVKRIKVVINNFT